MVLNGQELTHYDGVEQPVFSLNDTVFAYIARKDTLRGASEYFVVVNNQEGKRYTDNAQLRHLTLSPNGLRVAYEVVNAHANFAVIDGQEQKKYYGSGVYGFMFSPDSQHIAYIVIPGQSPRGLHLTRFVVLDGQEGPLYEGISDELTFTPDGTKLMYKVGKIGTDQRLWSTITTPVLW